LKAADGISAFVKGLKKDCGYYSLLVVRCLKKTADSSDACVKGLKKTAGIICCLLLWG